MNKLLFFVMATAASASFAATTPNDDKVAYKAATTKADNDYKTAKAACDAQSGTAKSQHVAAVNDAKAGKQMADAAQTGIDCSNMTGTDKASCETRSKTALAKDTVADSVITTKVKTELMAEPALKSLDVHVETTNGTVMLSGFVPSQAEVDKAVNVARNVKGVSKVQSSLRIK